MRESSFDSNKPTGTQVEEVHSPENQSSTCETGDMNFAGFIHEGSLSPTPMPTTLPKQVTHSVAQAAYAKVDDRFMFIRFIA